MAAPKGNRNAVGNRGGGRKSAYQEHADVKSLREMFFSEFSREEIETKFKSGKYSLKDVLVFKAFTGSEKALLAIFNKLFPGGYSASDPDGEGAEKNE